MKIICLNELDVERLVEEVEERGFAVVQRSRLVDQCCCWWKHLITYSLIDSLSPFAKIQLVQAKNERQMFVHWLDSYVPNKTRVYGEKNNLTKILHLQICGHDVVFYRCKCKSFYCQCRVTDRTIWHNDDVIWPPRSWDQKIFRGFF